MLVGRAILWRKIRQDKFQAFLTTPYSNKKIANILRFDQETILTRYFLSGHKTNTDPSGRAF
jgi:cytoskeletal protein RodZ